MQIREPHSQDTNQAAYQDYLAVLTRENADFRTAFRAAFLEALQEHLTRRQYEVLFAHAVERLKGREIAERLGISQSAVSRHLSRGRKRLQVLLTYNLELRHGPFRPQLKN